MEYKNDKPTVVSISCDFTFDFYQQNALKNILQLSLTENHFKSIMK